MGLWMQKLGTFVPAFKRFTNMQFSALNLVCPALPYPTSQTKLVEIRKRAGLAPRLGGGAIQAVVVIPVIGSKT